MGEFVSCEGGINVEPFLKSVLTITRVVITSADCTILRSYSTQ